MTSLGNQICAEQVTETLVCVKPGRRYELDGNQIVQFKHADSVLRGGTTNEEVLEMLLHRTKILEAEFPCVENKVAIIHMEEALVSFRKRAKRLAGNELKPAIDRQ